MKSKIFISYSYQDRRTAEIIMQKLQNNGLEVIIDNYHYENQYFMSNDTLYNMNPGDYMVLLISERTKSNEWYKYEFNNYVNKNISNRNITFVPVYLSKVNKFIKGNVVAFNFYNNFEKELEKLVDYLKYSQYINFDILDGHSFEQLSKELLREMKFEILEPCNQFNGYDFLAESKYNDPFGGKAKVKWIIECKYYKQNRPDLKTLKNMEYLLGNKLSDYNGLLITNGILTSTAYEFLDTITKHVSIRIVDGILLKKLLLKYPKLIEQFFIERMF